MENGGSRALQLHELTHSIAETVNRAFSQPLWVVAEVTDLRVAGNGHCYMQLIEKDARRGMTLASVRGIVWSSRWWLLRDSFAQQTGQQLQNGLKVMLLVQVQMHEQYGLSLIIVDFDPTYTLGEMERRRREILHQLTQEGIIDMNRELPFPTLPQRIAVISAEGAAGYGDFTKQLSGNAMGLQFYCHLFPAVMQGERTEASVIEALECIYEVQDLFDVVVIIRGGGATADLASFDSYQLAANVAQFPLPVITGIGHDRDQTVLDRVAHVSVKTPTAAAALLIDALTQVMQHLEELRGELREGAEGRMEAERQRLLRLTNAVRGTHATLLQSIAHLDMMAQRMQLVTRQRLQREEERLTLTADRLRQFTHQRLEREGERLVYMQRTVQMAQPDLILRRGFSITRLDGHAVRSAADVPPGATLEIQTADGLLQATAGAKTGR